MLIGTTESIGKHWQRQHSKKGCCAKKTQQTQLLVKRRHCSVPYGQGRSRAALFTCLALAISPDQARLLGAMRALNGASCAKAHQRMNCISCNLARQSSGKKHWIEQTPTRAVNFALGHCWHYVPQALVKRPRLASKNSSLGRTRFRTVCDAKFFRKKFYNYQFSLPLFSFRGRGVWNPLLDQCAPIKKSRRFAS